MVTAATEIPNSSSENFSDPKSEGHGALSSKNEFNWGFKKLPDYKF